MSYDPLQPDAYAEHLSEVNRSKEVIVAEDIRNAKGMLIARKGQHVSHETVQKIIQFKLIKPLEESVEVSDSLTGEKILDDVRNLFADERSREVHELYQLGAEIRRGANFLQRYPILRQKLTVLAMQLPYEYKKSLMVAWYSLLIARRLKLSPTDRDELFLAALLHDVGMLHIDRAIIGKQGQLSPDEWRTLQGHVAIGNIIVRQTFDMPPGPPRAVLEHHEIADGTGYLTGRRGDELSLMGQIIGVADAMCALLIKWEGQGRGLRDLLPILRVNSYVYHRDVCSAFIEILREHRLREDASIGDQDIHAYASGLRRDRDGLCNYTARIAELLAAMPESSMERMSVKAVFVVYEHLSKLLRSSGVLEEGHDDWLQSVARDRLNKQYREVQDTRLMLDEVRWQLSKLTRLLWTVEKDKNAMSAEEHHTFLEKLNALPKLPS
jgi:HD-GYP domain-containing protein (c-di-GMP phosphodiesterase class II)